MILRFLIEPESLKEVVDKGEWPTFLQYLAHFWPSHGLLVMPPDFASNLKESGLDATSLGEWQTFIMRDSYRKSTDKEILSGFEWVNVQSWESLSGYKATFDLALLQETRAACFNLLNGDEFCKHDPLGQIPIELARCNHILLTCRVKELERLAESAIPREETPDEIWNKRFRAYAMHSTSVAILDKYAVRDNQKGWQFLLRKLVEEGWQSYNSLQNVEIYSTYRDFQGPNTDSAPQIKSSIEAYGNSLLKEFGSAIPGVKITVKLLAEQDMKHDRWIRFDSNIVELSSGLSIFESNRTQAYGFQAKTIDTEREKEEERLRYLCTKRPPDNTSLLCVYAHPQRGK